jgi:branched-chain amino acid transport system ATP-binding protein
MSILLKVENLSRSFGGIHANSDISFDVKEGEILGVIGPNGAGKSTLFDLITGFTKSDRGQVMFKDKDITNVRPDLICRMGVGRTFQKLKPFADQTLLENVIVGALVKEKNLKVARDKALEIIDFVDLIEKRHHYAKELSTGQRKRLELARALATDPKLLLMDEVTGGVDQRTIPGLVELVLKLKKNGITVVTIEHNMKIIMDISDRILALNQGKRIAFDVPKSDRCVFRKGRCCLILKILTLLMMITKSFGMFH